MTASVGRRTTGLFTPVTKERHARLEPSRPLPEPLFGAYLRNGPNPAFVDPAAYSVLDGDGMIHGVFFEGRSVAYKNAWIETPSLKKERAAGRALYPSLDGLRPRIPGVLRGALLRNPANTNIVRHHGRYLALYEMGRPIALDDDLRTQGPVSFGRGDLPWFTAHPKQPAGSSRLYGFGLALPRAGMRYQVIDGEGHTVFSRHVPFEGRGIALCHDFAVSERWAVFVDCPMGVSLTRLAPTFDDEKPCRVHLVPRDDPAGRILSFTVPGRPFMLVHVANAHELPDGRVRLVLCLARDFHESRAWVYGFASPPSTVAALTVDLARGTVTLDETCLALEYPKVPDARVGVPHAYFYGLGIELVPREGLTYFPHVRKVRTDTLEPVATFGLGDQWSFSEPSFVPRASASREDDGWLVTFAHRRDGSAAKALLIPAADLAPDGVVEIPLPAFVPQGFHGNWMPRSRVEQ